MSRLQKWIAGGLCAALLAGGVLPASAGLVSNGRLGDLDADKVDTTDARRILQCAVGKLTLTAEELALADVDANGEVNTTDARLVLQKAVDKLAYFPAATVSEQPLWTVEGHNHSAGQNFVPNVPKSGIPYGVLTGAGWVKYGMFHFGDGGDSQLMLELFLFDGKETTLEVRLDDVDGELLGTITIDEQFTAETLYLSGIRGTHSVVLVLSQEDVGVTVRRLTYTYDWTSAEHPQLAAWQSAGLGMRLSFPEEEYKGGAFDAEAVVSLAKDLGAGYLLFPATWNETSRENLFFSNEHGSSEFLSVIKACEAQELPLGVYFPLYRETLSEMEPVVYRARIRELLAELILKYDIDILQLDATGTEVYTQAQLRELYEYCRSLKPSLIVSCPTAEISRAGEYVALTGAVGGEQKPFQTQYEAAGLDLPALLQTMGGVWGAGGNLLLNVTVEPDGALPSSVETLAGVGEWQVAHGDCLRGTTVVEFPYTYNKDVLFLGKEGTLYVLLLGELPQQLIIPPLTTEVGAVHWMGTEQTMTWMDAVGGTVIEPTAPPNTAVPELEIAVTGTPAAVTTGGERSDNLITDAAMLTASANGDTVGNLIDDNAINTWGAGAEDAWIEVDFGDPTVFNMVRCVESAARVDGFAVEIWDGEDWQTVVTGTELNKDRLIAFDAVVAMRMRLHITSTKTGAAALLKQFEIYAGEKRTMYTTIDDWNGYKRINFTVNGRESYIVCPKVAAEGNPWVWRCEFFGAFDSVDRELLDRGWYLVYHSMSELYGNSTAMQYMTEFQQVAEEDFALSGRPVLFGFSRGGAYAVNYAHFHPDNVGALYLDAPFTNFNGASRQIYEDLYQRVLECYGLTEEEMKVFDQMPNDYAASVAEAGIPVVICVGLADVDVYYEQNAAVFAERYTAAGGNLLLLEKPGVGHHPHSFSDSVNVNKIADFIEQNILKDA